MISFIIPAYDEERLLGATLDAIHASARAAGEPYEVIVVDDASQDRTSAVAEEHGARVVRVTHRQISATRNSGAREARGDWFVFVDADTVIEATVLRAAIRALREGAAGGGSAVEFDGRVPLYARILLAFGVRLFHVAGLACGCFLFCTRTAFMAAGGFDEAMYGAEEIAMSRTLRRHGRFVVVREAVRTSGRKVRAHSGWELVGVLARLFARGPSAVNRREGLELWYAGRREDPESLARERAESPARNRKESAA